MNFKFYEKTLKIGWVRLTAVMFYNTNVMFLVSFLFFNLFTVKFVKICHRALFHVSHTEYLYTAHGRGFDILAFYRSRTSGDRNLHVVCNDSLQI